MNHLMNRKDAFLFLTRCLAPEDRDANLAGEIAAGRVCWERVVEVASDYWMTLVLYRELGEKHLLDLLPPNERNDLLEYFQAINAANAARNQGLLEHAEEVVCMLNGIGVEPILLKGAAHLASGLYPDPAMRFMYDIDLLVPDDRALECWFLLLAAGYETCGNERHNRAECLPREEWPAIRRPDREGELEIHRVVEWNHLLSSPSLYVDARPVALGGGRARILSATSQLIFALAHPYVHHTVSLRPGVPFRDLYDAMLLTRRLGREIQWPLVMETFDRAGDAESLRIAGMMWRRLFSQDPPGAIDPPRWGWVYWQRCLLTISSPRWGQIADHLTWNIRSAAPAFSGTTEGKRMRRELSRPSVILRKLRTAARLYSLGWPPARNGRGNGA